MLPKNSDSGGGYSSGIGKKRSAKKQITQNDDEINDCSICMEQLSKIPEENKKLKIKLDERGRPICGHTFHKECIDNWIRTKINQNSAIYPLCPECRTEIKEDEWPPGLIPMQHPQDDMPQRVIQRAQQRPQVRQETVAERRTNLIWQLQAEQQDQSPVLFMGIVVCINGQILTKYLNTDLELGINNTIGDLKQAILARTQELANMRPYLCQMNLGRQVNNLFSFTGLTTEREPSFRIQSIYFGTPSNCENIWQLNMSSREMLGDNNSSLINVYKEYQNSANIYFQSHSNQNLSRVTTLHTLRWRPTGPEDPGQVYASFYYNQDNPIIPERFRANTRDNQLDPRSTTHSLSWLVVNLECNTFSTSTNNVGLVTNTLQENPRVGGKTRNKNKKTRDSNKTKSSNKNKKTVRRRIK